MLNEGAKLPDGFRPIEQSSPIPSKVPEMYQDDGPFDLLIGGKIVRGYWGGLPTKGGGKAYGWITPTGLRGYYTPNGWRRAR